MNDKELGIFIKERRKALGLSLEDIGSSLGLSRSTIQRWETGNISKIKRSHLEMLSKVLSIPIDVLLGYSSNTKIDDPELIKARSRIQKKLDKVHSVQKCQQIEKFIDTFILEQE